MKKLTFLILCALLLWTAACGSLGGSKAFTFKVDGKDETVETKSAVVIVRRDLIPAQIKFAVANFDIDTSGESAAINELTKTPEQMRVSFGISGEKDKDFNNPVKTGEYQGEAEKYNKVMWVDIYHTRDGKQIRTNLRNLKGSVNITSVTDTEIAGSIDVSDGDKTVKGNFTAKKILN